MIKSRESIYLSFLNIYIEIGIGFVIDNEYIVRCVVKVKVSLAVNSV